MPTTPLLGISELTPNQTGKETTINDAIVALEGAGNASLAVAMAGGDVTLSVTQFTRNFIFKCSGQTANRILNVPALVNGANTQRVFCVLNQSTTYAVTVQVTGAPGTTITIPKGKSRLLAVDGAGNISIVANAPEIYRFGAFAVSSILADEVLLDHVVADAFTMPANMAGSKVQCGVNPTATWTANVQKNGATIGTLSLSTSGVPTLATTGGVEVDFAVDDVITVVAPTVADATIARLRITFRAWVK